MMYFCIEFSSEWWKGRKGMEPLIYCWRWISLKVEIGRCVRPLTRLGRCKFIGSKKFFHQCSENGSPIVLFR